MISALRISTATSCVAVLLCGQAVASNDPPPPPDPGVRVDVSHSARTVLTLPHPADAGSQAAIVIEQGGVSASYRADDLTLQAPQPESDLWNGEMSVLLMDIDFDGYTDVGVLDGVGYGGVNTFWQFWRADPQRGFVNVGTLPNPERDDVMGTVRAASRSGPVWSTGIYLYEAGRMRLIVEREHRGEYDRVHFPPPGKGQGQTGIISAIAPDPWDAQSLNDPAYHQTAIATQPRVYFHNAPDASTRRGAYLVDGDEARVLDVSADEEWMSVTFTHRTTGRTTTGWLRVEEMVFVQG